MRSHYIFGFSLLRQCVLYCRVCDYINSLLNCSAQSPSQIKLFCSTENTAAELPEWAHFYVYSFTDLLNIHTVLLSVQFDIPINKECQLTHQSWQGLFGERGAKMKLLRLKLTSDQQLSGEEHAFKGFLSGCCHRQQCWSGVALHSCVFSLGF